MECYITLDVGGTQIKAAAINEMGEFINENVNIYPSFSAFDKDTILNNFYKIIVETASAAANCGYKLLGVALAFPGEFDYENGICLISGISKYDSIYGCDIKQYLHARIIAEDIANLFYDTIKVHFLNDVAAFALGEISYGYAKDYAKTMCLCIGTGAGSAFIRDGFIVTKAEESVPPKGYIYNTPFKDGTIDDYISKRGIEKLSEKHTGEILDGMELSIMASANTANALAVFAEFDANLKQAVAPFIKEFRPDCFILGGQIAKSSQLFTLGLQDCCESVGCKLFIEHDTSRLAFLGLYYYAKTIKD